MFRYPLALALALLLVLGACVATPPTQGPTTATAQSVAFRTPGVAAVPATGPELVRQQLSAGPITYTRHNGQTAVMHFSVGGLLRVENSQAGRTTWGRWTVGEDGIVCQRFPSDTFCATFTWGADKELVIDWITSGGTRRTQASQGT